MAVEAAWYESKPAVSESGRKSSTGTPVLFKPQILIGLNQKYDAGSVQLEYLSLPFQPQ